MNLKDMESRLVELKFEIGKVRLSRNLMIMGTFVGICSMGTLFLANRETNIPITLAIGVGVALWYGQEKKLDSLITKQRNLEIESSVEKRLSLIISQSIKN